MKIPGPKPRPLIERFNEKWEPIPESGCWIWVAGLHKTGYGIMWHKGRPEKAHRISYEIHNGKIPKGLFVCHACDVRSCVNPNHLWVGTADDNVQDMNKKMRMAYGERISKLSNIDVLQIKTLLALPEEIRPLQKEIAKEFNINQSSVSHIKSGRIRRFG